MMWWIYSTLLRRTCSISIELHDFECEWFPQLFVLQPTSGQMGMVYV